MMDFFYNIGEKSLSVLSFFRTDYFVDSLPIMGKGMLGIFIVTAVIIGVVTLINRIPSSDDK